MVKVSLSYTHDWIKYALLSMAGTKHFQPIVNDNQIHIYMSKKYTLSLMETYM